MKLGIMILMMLTLFSVHGFAQDSSETVSTDQQAPQQAQAQQKGATDPQSNPPAGKFAPTEAGFVACFECRAKQIQQQASDDICSGRNTISLTAASFGSQQCFTSGGSAPVDEAAKKVNK